MREFAQLRARGPQALGPSTVPCPSASTPRAPSGMEGSVFSIGTMRSGRRHRTGSVPHDRLRVLMVDDEARESFRELASALRTAGVSVVRAAPANAPRLSFAGRIADWLIFGPTSRTKSALTDSSRASRAERQALLDPPTRDVHAPEHVAANLAATPEWSALAKVRPDLDPTLIYDKLATTQFAEGLGIGVPRTWRSPESAQYPVVVKARHGFGGRNVRMAYDASELTDAWTSLSALEPRGAFVQEFIPGGVTSTGGVAFRGEVLTVGAWNVFPHPNEPLGPPASVTMVDDSAAIESTRRLVQALGYTGMFNLNFVHDRNGMPLLIDLNCRVFDSWQAVSDGGLDMLGTYLSALAGRTRVSLPTLRLGETFPVVRMSYVTGESWTELAASVARTTRVVWHRRKAVGPRWFVATQLRVASRLVAQSMTLARTREPRSTAGGAAPG